MFLIDDLLTVPGQRRALGISGDPRRRPAGIGRRRRGHHRGPERALHELETGQITEAEFDAQEKVLLDRLDRLQAQEEPEAAPVKKPAKPRPGRKTPAPGSSAAVI